MISIRSLHKYFNKNKQNEIHVINDVNLELPEQGMVALFGKSGCGKTTLLNAIGGLDKTESGSILIDGNSIRQNPDFIRNHYIGYIFQNYNLNKQETVFDNIADALRLCGMTDKAVIEERVMAALANVGMDKYKSRTPDTLSGGQMQRVAIARAIVKNPKIILADEPTGNLDEANTLLIMDLLKKIAETHLVILVTHEANLVDYYCDKVIELKDGKIISSRDNYGANGLAARSKNDIYLGELDKSEAMAGGVSVEYYGQSPKVPVKLRIVNSGGKIYLSVDDETVQILDRTSEVKLREGVYTEVEKAEENKANVDMSKLPPMEGSHFGRLFNFKGSFKSGYSANFKKNKKSTKALRACMFLFSLVLVFMSANLGTAFKSIEDVQERYNQNMFYLYTNSTEISEKLNASVGKNGIDGVQILPAVPNTWSRIIVSPGRFESFSTDETTFEAYTTLLDIKFAGEMKLLAGKNTGLDSKDLVITSTLADRIIKASTVGYVRSYEDLIGLSAKYSGTGSYQTGLRIVGVIESKESAAYRSSIASAGYVLSNLGFNSFVKVNTHSTLELNNGETYLILANENNAVGLPKKDETIKINGKSFKIKDIIPFYNSYEEYLMSIGSTLVKPHNSEKPEDGYYRIGMDEYFSQAIQKQYYPDHPNIRDYQNWSYIYRLDDYTKSYVANNFYTDHPNLYNYESSSDPDEQAIYAEYLQKVEEYKSNEDVVRAVKEAFVTDYPDFPDVDKYHLYWEYSTRVESYKTANYTEYYEVFYEQLDGFIKHNHIVRPEIYTWLYVEKGFDEVKYNNVRDTDYLYLLMYRSQNGKYPTYREFCDTDRSALANEFNRNFSNLYDQYHNEFYNATPDAYNHQNKYLLSEADYISLADYVGESHESITAIGGMKPEYIIMGKGMDAADIEVESDGYYVTCYTSIHSSDPDATAAFLQQIADEDLATVGLGEYQKKLYSPDILFDELMNDFRTEVITKFVVLIVFLVIMSLCMYFIMRSSLMARIKEVGIYRAIGVSRKNLTLRFLVEAFVLTTFTVFIGYLISSGALFALSASVSLLESILYYPVWLAGVLLAIIYAVCIACGLIPIMSLLRKTPSEILSKYDI